MSNLPAVVETGQVMTLDDLADEVRSQYQRSKDALGDAVEAYFACGRALLAARQALPDTQSFGAWFRAQQFGLTQQWAHTLRTAAEHEPDVRAAITSQLVNGRANIEKAVKQVVAQNKPDVHQPAQVWHEDTDLDAYSTIVIDPPWRYDNVATRGAAEDHYPTMSMDELASMSIPAADDAHIYLWVTNGFIREGFDLLDAWGFTYKTCLTWCKPQIGMGNWFRNSTEHVLFGVRGKLPTLRNDVPTHFTASRTRHSAKPDSFYDLVESCSPGPWLEMFARRPRYGWAVWGNEV